MTHRLLRAGVLLLAPILVPGSVAVSQPAVRDTTVSSSGSALVVPDARYSAGRLHRAVLGDDYRDLWTMPVTLPKLDLAHVAGGLRPLVKGGSMQTSSLRFRGANNREYVFRSATKDFLRGLPPEMSQTMVGRMIQDQASAYHPAAAIVVSSLLDATDIPHARPILLIMPDDSVLGQFRQEFAGMVGTFEERAGEKFGESDVMPGALDVISSEKLFERLRNDSRERFDERAYLAARLFDIWVGDRDRHRDQWRWARFASTENAPWIPIPRDRDMAFARMEGVAPAVIRAVAPRFVTFGNEYPPMEWLNWNAREIDRRLMGALSRLAWDSVAVTLQSQMTDSVIRKAIQQMPQPYIAASGEQLMATLLARRAGLRAAAAEYYGVLAREAEVLGTNKADRATVTRESDGSVVVELFSMRADERLGKRVPYFSRRFWPNETKEVRITLDGGNDRVAVIGEATGNILVRVVGGEGNDVTYDSILGGDHTLRVYDAAGNDQLSTASDRTIDRRTYTPPHSATPEDAPRDWGTLSYFMPAVSAQAGSGLILGASRTRIQYGFRQSPYVYSSTLRVDASMSELRPRLAWSLDVPRTYRSGVMGVDVLASGIDLVRYYGVGNETNADAPTSYYRSRQTLYRIEPRWTIQAAKKLSVSGSVFGAYTVARNEEQSLFNQEKPYGSGSFGEVGMRADVVADHRDSPVLPTRGYRLNASAAFAPSVWNVQEPFGALAASGSAYASISGRFAPTFAMRVGGRHTMGRTPVQDASQLGGIETLRGFDQQRFTGQSMLYGSSELRVPLARVNKIVPGRIGALAFVDAGRVFADNESSSRWHSSYGGGIWLAPLLSQYTMSVSLARSNERVAWYISHGFAF